MSRNDLSLWMWSEACRLLDRAENLQRQFFGLDHETLTLCWEPPTDVYETDREILVHIALPGVESNAVEVRFDSGVLIVAGERRMPPVPGPAFIRRMEIPHGRFERRIRLEPGEYEFTRRDLVDGCLQLVLRKLF
ncbi:MAG: hypothetical protein QOK29_1645 [Rhodospirillaceae bacterium]|jgi:HSP20 family molecular chaperone IbpA|nr:hypothetical protein [Rhodospirillaceae bacterium]